MFGSSVVGLILTALFVEILNFLVVVGASLLLYYEYVRHLSEAWYCHKLFIWVSFVFQFCHLWTFFELYSGLNAMLTALRCIIFIAIVFLQMNTRQKEGSRLMRIAFETDDDNFVNE